MAPTPFNSRPQGGSNHPILDAGDAARVAGHIFRQDLGGAVPESCAAMRARMEESGARVIRTEGDPPGWSGLHAFGSIYVSASLPVPERRRVAWHLWACYLCWRDRGGPGFTIYDPDAPSDPYRAVAATFERMAAEADPYRDGAAVAG